MTIIIFIKTILFLSLICALGLFIKNIIKGILRSDCRYKTAFEDLPLVFLLGTGTYVFFEMLLSISGIRSHISHFVFLLLSFLTLNYFVCFKNRICFSAKDDRPAKNKISAAAVIIFAVFIPLFLGMILAAAFPQFDIDMVAHILIKAKIFLTDTYKSSVFLHDKVFANAQAKYPPFTGIFFNLLFLFGCNTISCYQAVNYFIFFLLGISVYFCLKDKIPRWQAGAWFFIFISTANYIPSQFIMDSTDVALSLSFLVTALYFIKFYESQSAHNLFIYSISLGIGTLIKNEGLFFSIIMLALTFIIRRKSVSKCAIIWFLISGPWILYRLALPNPATGPENIIASVNILSSIKNLPQAIITASDIFLKKWNALFILWVPAMLFLLKSKHKKECFIFSYIIASLIIFYFIMMWLYIGRIPSYSNTFFRVLCHVYPMALICAALAIDRLIITERRRDADTRTV